MNKPKQSVTIRVEYFTGHDEGDDGTPYYVASCDDLMFTTDGTTFEELLANIRECLALCMEDTDSEAEYGVARDARIQIVMDLPQVHAKTA